MTKRGRKPLEEPSERDRAIWERLTSSPDTMDQLARRYRISKQRVHQIMNTAKRFGYAVKRARSRMRHQRIDRCALCMRIVQMARKEELVTRRQIATLLNIDDHTCRWHLNQLKKAGWVSKTFATIRSEKIVNALRFYKDSSLSVYAVGKMFGFKNFYSILNYQRRKGIDVRKRPIPRSFAVGEEIDQQSI